MTSPHPSTTKWSTDYDRIVGEELTRARVNRGWSRWGLVARGRLPFTARVLGKIETGAQNCSLSRLSMLCQTFGVALPDFLEAVERRMGVRPPSTVTLRLRVLADVDNPSLGLIPTWAAVQAALDGDLITLSWHAVHQMAAACRLGVDVLLNLLVTHHVVHHASALATSLRNGHPGPHGQPGWSIPPADLVGLGAALSAARARTGMTLTDLAEQSSISRRTLVNAERGHTAITVITLHHLAHGLETPVSHLARGLCRDHPPPAPATSP